MLLFTGGLFLLLIKFNVFSLRDLVYVDEKMAWFFLAASLLMILFSSDLTVTADKSSRMLRLHYKYLLFQRTKEIPFDDIADIQSHSNKGNIELPSNEYINPASISGYRLVAVHKDGTIIPFRRLFTPYDTKKEATADLRFAVTGSRQSDVIKAKSTEYTLPIKMTIYWWATAFFIFGIFLFGGFAVWAYSSEHDMVSALVFVLFGLLGVYALISARSTIEIDQNTIVASSPPHGVYKMRWQDVQFVETNGAAFAFVGDDKHLVISLGFVGNGKREFLAFFDDFVQERKIEVKPIAKMRFSQKNTKIS